MKTFYPALIVMSRSENGTITSVRPTATRFLHEDAARERYGDSFIRLLDVECHDNLAFYSPIKSKAE